MFGKNLFKVILTESALFSPESVNDTILAHTFFRLRQLTGFYLRALTRYQLHSPFVFEWANAVLEDRRWYYPFRDIEALRAKMLAVDTEIRPSGFGAAPAAQQPVRLGKVVRRSAVSPEKGRMLFRLVNWLRPARMLELGCSTGISAMYLASAAAQSARLLTLEGDAALAAVARTNFRLLGLEQAEVIEGEFHRTLAPALDRLGGPVDLVYFDGDHRPEPTLDYFETCLAHAHDRTVFVFDDVYWSPEMTQAWERICAHPKVTLTLDAGRLAFAFIDPDFLQKQHLRVVPTRWKPWKIF